MISTENNKSRETHKRDTAFRLLPMFEIQDYCPVQSGMRPQYGTHIIGKFVLVSKVHWYQYQSLNYSTTYKQVWYSYKIKQVQYPNNQNKVNKPSNKCDVQTIKQVQCIVTIKQGKQNQLHRESTILCNIHLFRFSWVLTSILIEEVKWRLSSNDILLPWSMSL